jgi:heme/copper-type cytochrome/quinol oxidase subunit 1
MIENPGGLKLDRESYQVLYHWVFFAAFSLVFAGIFAFLAAMTRTPAVELLPSADYFRVTIVGHVIFALGVWFLGFMGALWCYAASKRRTLFWKNWRPGFWISVLGMALIAFTSLLAKGEPQLIDYVPLLDHPIYFAGLFFIALGVTATIVAYVFAITGDGEKKLDIPSFGMLLVAAIIIIAFLSVLFSALSNGTSNYRVLFWGPGHIIQFANSLAMVVAWFILLESSLKSRVNEILVKKLMLIYLFAALLLPLIYFLPTHEQTRLFTLGMGYGIGVPSSFLMLIVLHALWQRARGALGLRGLPWRSPVFSSLVLSLALLGVGGAIGVPGLESNLRVPAHYHGALGAVTMAFMGMTHLLLKYLGIKVYSEKTARIQPYLYGLGLLVIILGLFWAGSYGAPRKAFGYENPVTAVAMNVMGAGAIIAVIGGAAFVVNTMLSLLKREKETQ